MNSHFSPVIQRQSPSFFSSVPPVHVLLLRAPNSVDGALEACPDSQDALETRTSIQDDRAAVRDHLESAKEAQRSGDFRLAESEWQAAWLTWRDADDVIHAKEELDSAKQTYTARLEEARGHLRQKNFGEAERARQEALEVSPDSDELRDLAGELKGAERDAEERAVKRKAALSGLGKLSGIAVASAVVLGVVGFLAWVAWRWTTGTAWPWLGEHKGLLIAISALAALGQALVHQSRRTDTYRETYLQDDVTEAGAYWIIAIGVLIGCCVAAGIVFFVLAKVFGVSSANSFTAATLCLTLLSFGMVILSLKID